MMKTKKLLALLAAVAGIGNLTSCEITGSTPLTATVSLWGEGWETSVDIATITTKPSPSSKNPIDADSGK
jgi:hypothetical protein